MARRTQIIDLFRGHLEEINSIVNVHSRYKYLDEINDFPTICFVPRGEVRDHFGAGRKLAILQIDLRLYHYDRDQADLELLLREVEEKIATFTGNTLEAEFLAIQAGDVIATQDNKFFIIGDAETIVRLIENAQVVTFATDEGLMRPYQVGDLQILITYEVDV